MADTINNIYNSWLECMTSNYEEQFLEPIIKRYSYWHGGTSESVESKGRSFNAAYEVYIYAFFLGLYANQRRPLDGKKRNFSMEMKRWGNINIGAFPNRKTYPIIQKYVFAALIAKTDIDLLAIDRGDITIENGVSELMKTLCEYANGGFYLMSDKVELVPDYFDGSSAFLDFIQQYRVKK